MINKLINDLAYDTITLNQALTRAKIIAFSIDNKTFREWIKKELEGYEFDDPILPDYRKVKCAVKLTISDRFGRKQMVPLNAEGWKEINEILSVRQIGLSIAALEDNYSRLTSSTALASLNPSQIKLFEELTDIRRKHNRAITDAVYEIATLDLKNIIDLTKQKLIDTLLELDKEFPNLENNLKMNDEDNNKAQNIITNNIYGNNNPLNVATGNKVEQKDFLFKTSVNFSDLEKFGVQKKDIKELESIVEINKEDKIKLKEKAMKWLGSVSSSVAARGLYEHIPSITEFVQTLI